MKHQANDTVPTCTFGLSHLQHVEIPYLCDCGVLVLSISGRMMLPNQKQALAILSQPAASLVQLSYLEDLWDNGDMIIFSHLYDPSWKTKGLKLLELQHARVKRYSRVLTATYNFFRG